MIEFLKRFFGDEALTFDQLNEKLTADDTVHIVNVADGSYVPKEDYDSLLVWSGIQQYSIGSYVRDYRWAQRYLCKGWSLENGPSEKARDVRHLCAGSVQHRAAIPRSWLKWWQITKPWLCSAVRRSCVGSYGFGQSFLESMFMKLISCWSAIRM